MKKSILILVLILSINLFAGNEDKTVAKVGKREIKASEFLDRFEMTPWNKQIREIPVDVSKKEFLYTLVAEKLWAQKASELGFDTSAQIKENFKSLEKMFVKDALYRQEIMNKVNITDADLKKAYYKAHCTLKGDFLTSKDEKEINDLYKALKSGANYDTLFALRENKVLGDSLSVGFGKFDEQLEDSLYNMKPGSFTAPLKYQDAWYIIRIKRTQISEVRNAKDEDVIMKQAGMTLKDRETSKYYNEFMDKFFKGKKTDVNGKAFQIVASKIISVLNEKFRNRPANDSDKVYLDANDFLRIKKDLGNKILSTDLIKFNNQSSTVSDFLNIIHYDENAFTSNNQITIKKVLEGKLKTFMQGEMLALEGYNRGLQNLPEVKSQIQMWKDNYLYNALKNSITDSIKVDDREVQDYYNKRKDIILPVQVNIVEVLTDNLETVEKVLSESGKGVDMHELAQKYSKRVETKDNNWESGFFPATSRGEIGRIAGTMNVGDVYGPLKLAEGYTVFKLIAKKDNEKFETRPLGEVKDELKKSLSGMKRYHGTLNYTVRLAKEYGVSIDEKVLGDIQVTNIFSIMFRNMGFGGKILATPLMGPNDEWVQPWKDGKSDTP